MRGNGGTPSRFNAFCVAGRACIAVVFTLVMSLVTPTASQANSLDFLESTYLIEINQGSSLSNMAFGFSNMGYESAYGDRIRLNKWYATQWVDTRLGFLTQLSSEFGLIWGFSTGERADKYKIDPSLKVGFLFSHQLSKQSSFSLSASTILGGRLQERACTADYGDVGGIQKVNCRLAASTMAPAETLNYLVNQGPQHQKFVMFRFVSSF